MGGGQSKARFGKGTLGEVGKKVVKGERNGRL